MIRNILVVTLVMVLTAVGIVVNLLILPLHNWLIIFWSKFLLLLLGVKLNVNGKENLPLSGPGIFIINHESALDIPIAIAAVEKPVRFMAKQELFRLPFFGWVLKLSNHIPIDRANRKKAIASIERVSKKLVKRKIFIIVSPEGTRSYTGKIAAFKKGAFRLAESRNLVIIPITIMGARYCVPNKTFKVIPGTVNVQINPAINISQFENIDDCIQSVRNIMVEQKNEFEKDREHAV